MQDYVMQCAGEFEELIGVIDYLTEDTVSNDHKAVQIDYMKQKMEEVLYLLKTNALYWTQT